ncbi:MAG: UDP-N-acetylglucosamine--N-acetylmuramyl-(pentapeptide) pyrophosphoryl-undecaprenol N-acetylglucosamine transferase [Chlamydiae bacterium]|nr:UDP-N-acetylglucosamine--N-acetylmuramyl-(pentapeptide) pyrophosphoryl-undecaprenol N-acetylglucosamine transferase [Chlamydiota bacterium]
MTRKEKSRLEVVIAAGGTGGHLFPAQALAQEILQTHPNARITFLGAGLKTNAYFKQELYSYVDIKSATPMKKNPVKVIKALLSITKGLFRCMRYFKKSQPDLIVGFGSYHTFPVLLAGKLSKVPIMIFESNALPGRVNRFCSKWAKLSAIQFSHASEYLAGKSICVKMPHVKRNGQISKEEARDYFQLSREKFTFLIFGGSQGAQAINRFFCGALEPLLAHGIEFQVIHFVGSEQRVEKLRSVYSTYQIPCCVKAFEEKMDFAYSAADLTISRAGAATLAELIEFTVPSILIPYPFGSENHQTKNAAYLADEIQGGLAFEERELDARILAQAIIDIISTEKLTSMKRALQKFKEEGNKQDLCSLILENI